MPLSVLPGGSSTARTSSTRPASPTTPTTIDELDAAVDKLKATGVAPIALGAKDAWPAAHWYYWFALRACTPGHAGRRRRRREDFDDPCWSRPARTCRLRRHEPFNDGFLTTSAQQGAGSSAGLVANHKAAHGAHGRLGPGRDRLADPDEKPLPDLGWFPFPAVSGGKGEPGAIMGGVDGYSCSAKAPKECADFLNYIATTDVQRGLLQGVQRAAGQPGRRASSPSRT